MTPAEIFRIIIQHLLEALRLSMRLKDDEAKDDGIDEEFTPLVEAFLKNQGVEKQKSYNANIKLSGPAERNRK